MPAEQIQAYENAGNIFKDKLDKKKTENTDRDFRRVMGEKKKKKKCGKKEESWFDKRQKIIRARLKAQANLNAERRGEMSRIEQENHAKIQAAGANRLHNFLVEDTGREKHLPENVTEKEYVRNVNTCDKLLFACQGQKRKRPALEGKEKNKEKPNEKYFYRGYSGNGKIYSAKCNSHRKTGIPHISGRRLFPGGACLVYMDE